MGRFTFATRALEAIRRSHFARSVLTLGVGAVVSQLIPLAAYPLLSRLYTPAQFGVLALVSSIFSIISKVGTLQYKQAILVVEGAWRVPAVLMLCFGVGTLVHVVSIPVLYAIYGLGYLPGFPAHWLILVSVACSFAYTIYYIYNEWCVREGYFGKLSQNKVINALANALGKISLCWWTHGLVFGELAGRLIASGVSLRHFIRQIGHALRGVKRADALAEARHFAALPRYSFPGTFIGTLADHLPVFLIGYYFQNELLGQYSMATMVLSLPISVIGMTFSDAFRHKASRLFAEQGNCRTLYRKLLAIFAPVALVGCVAAMLILPTLFRWVLGNKWDVAGQYAVILCPSVFIGLLNTVFSSMWVIANKLREALYWYLLHLGCTFAGFWVAFHAYDSMQACLVGLSIALSISYAINLLFTYKFSRRNERACA